MAGLSRRAFVTRVGAGAVAAALAGRARAAAEPPPFPGRLGVCSGVGRAADLKAHGAQYVEDGVQRFLVPGDSAEAFARNLEKAQAAPLPVPACNGFLPGSLKCVGPEANHEAVLKYAETAFQRAKQAGVEVIVFGSGGSRRIPEGFAKEEAERQFADLLRRMGPLAAAGGVTIAIEPLRRQECNFINTVVEGAKLAEAAGHPAIRLLADLYHMLQNGEAPADLRTVAPLLVHTHVAEKAERTAPGVKGDDLRPFLGTLKAVGYRGRMSIEGKWEIGQLQTAFDTIRQQAG